MINLKYRNYKQVLTEISKQKQVLVTISLWTHNSKRMSYKVPFEQLRGYMDGDMSFKYGNYKLSFKTINDKQVSFQMYKLRIAKVDYIEFV